MDGVLFEKWVQNIDKKLTTEESIVLLVDNYQAQLTIDNLNLTEIIFMSLINPRKLWLMNQGTPWYAFWKLSTKL